MNIAFCFDQAIDREYGLELQQFLGLQEFSTAESSDFSHLLTLDAQGLSLQSLHLSNRDKHRRATRVDFLDPALVYRQTTSGKQQGLAKAVGLNKHAPMHVLDATAGLGRDAFILASLGCRVSMLEQSALIYALLADGMKRAQTSEQAQDVLSRMSLQHKRAQDYFFEIQSGEQPKPDVIYLDPMFPARTKSAQVKKDISLLQEVLEPEADLDNLIIKAKACAAHRVVLKRAGNKVEQGALKPSFIVPGKSAHFEVFV